MKNLNSSDIIPVLNYVLIGAFVLVIVGLLYGFIRGLFRGWRYGTYRLGYFLIHIIIGLALLDVIANALGQIPLSSLLSKESESITFNDKEIAFSITTIEGTIKDFIQQFIYAYSPSTSPDSVVAISYSLTQSLLKLIAVFLEGILLVTVVNGFSYLLWHIAFKRIIPIDFLKESYKRGKVISGFEELVCAILALCMIMIPCSSLLNSIAHGFNEPTSEAERERLKADNSTYALVSDVANAYNNSVFAKTFFSLRDGEGYSFDQGLMNWLTGSDYKNGDKEAIKVSFVKELQYVANIGSLAVETGILSGNSTKHQVYLFLTSQYSPLLLHSLAKSDLISGLMPFAFSVLTNMDAVEQYIGNRYGIDYSETNWSDSISNIASLFDDVQQSGIVDLLSYNESGDEIVFDTNNASTLFSDEKKAKFEDIFSRMSNDNDSWKVFNDLLISFAMNTVINAPSNEEGLSLADFFPVVSEDDYVYDEEKGRNVPTAIPDSYSSLNLSDEIGYIYRSFARLDEVSRDFTGSLLEGVINKNIDFHEFASMTIDHIDDVVSIFTGEDENGNVLLNEETGISENKDCLLDSSLICNAMPKVFTMLGDSLASTLNVSADVDSVNQQLFYDDNSELLPLNERIINEKNEVSHLLSVASSFAKTDAGKALLTNFDAMPGITYNQDGKQSLNHIDREVLDALASSLSKIDTSIFLSTIIPDLFSNVLSKSDDALSAFDISPSDFDFKPVDENGKSILGNELGKLLSMYADCQDLFNYIKNNADTLSSMSDEEMNRFLKGLAPFTKDSEEGVRDSSLYRLLTGFSDSKILNHNPNHPEDENYNYRLIMNKVLSSTLGEGYSYSGDISSVENENAAICDILAYMIDGDLFRLFRNPSISISSFLDVDFESLLAPLQETTMLRHVFASYLDHTICDALRSSDEALENVSFHNVTDWAKEGKTLNLLIAFSDRIGDFSNLDLLKSEPDAARGIVASLSASQIFVDKDGDYHFGQFLYYTLMDKMGDGSSEKAFFADRNGTTYEQLLSDMTSLSQTDWEEESDVFGNIVAALSTFGGVEELSKENLNFHNANLEGFSPLLDALADSRSMGRVLAYHLYERIGEELKKNKFELGGGYGDDTLSEKVGNLNIDEIWESYDASYEGILTDRKKEFALLDGILRSVTTLYYGLVNDDGVIDLGFSLNSTNGNYLIKPVLGNMSKSIVFNSLNKNAVKKAEESGRDVSFTAFECEMAQIVYDSGIYGKDNEGSHDVYNQIRNEYVKSIRPEGFLPEEATAMTFKSFAESYNKEISSIVSIVDGFHDLDIDLSSFSLKNFFTDPSTNKFRADADIRKVNLDAILYSINDSHLFYQVLPDKLNEAFSSETVSGLNTDSANTEYLRVYASDEVKGEIRTLTRALYYVGKTGLGESGASLSLDSIDPESVSELLSTMANSYVFNSLEEKDDTKLTVFQNLLSKILGGDDSELNEFYYLEASPKDKANSSHYNSSSTKAEYVVKNTFKNLNDLKPGEKEPTEILNGDTYSLKTFLKLLHDDSSLSSALGGKEGKSLLDLESDTLQKLLSEINGNDLLYDCVPNALAKFIYGGSLKIDGFDMSLANPFFSYYYAEDSDSFTSEPDYTKKYPDSEIEIIKGLIGELNPNGEMGVLLNGFGTASINSADSIGDMKELLLHLYHSCVFHRGGAYHSDTYSSSVVPEKGIPNDLTVFEQAIYRIYSESSLAENAYSDVYDKLQFDTYQLKLHDYIQKATDVDNRGGDNVYPLKNFDGFSWASEINALTISDDGTAGLLNVALEEGLLSGGTTLKKEDFSYLDANKLDDIQKLTLALNELTIVNDAIPLQIESLLLGQMHLDTYTSFTETFDFSSDPQTSFTLGDENSPSFGFITGLDVIGDNVSYSYSYRGNYLGESNDKYDSSIKWSTLRASHLTLTGANITKITVTFDTSDYFLGKAKMKDGGIESLTTFAKGIVDANGGSYPSFNDKQNNYLSLMKTDMIKSLIGFLNDAKGFFNRGYKVFDSNSICPDDSISPSFLSRDITFDHMLSFSFVYPGVAQYDIDLGKYLARGSTYPYGNISDVFKANKTNGSFYDNEEAFLRDNLASLTLNDVVIGNDEPTKVTDLSSVSLTRYGDIVVQTGAMNFTIDASTTKMLGLSKITDKNGFPKLLEVAKGTSSAFGKQIASGMLAKMILVQDEYAGNGIYLGSPIKDAEAKNVAASVGSSEYRRAPFDQTSHQASANSVHDSVYQNRSVYEFADALIKEENTSTLMNSYLTIEKNIGVLSHLTSLPSDSEREAAASAMGSLDANSNDNDLLLFSHAFYLGEMYDALTWNYYFVENFNSSSHVVAPVSDFQSVQGLGYLSGIETPFSFTNVARAIYA